MKLWKVWLGRQPTLKWTPTKWYGLALALPKIFIGITTWEKGFKDDQQPEPPSCTHVCDMVRTSPPYRNGSTHRIDIRCSRCHETGHVDFPYK